ncbi:ATP-dependent DNA helicase RecG [Lentilactobacillus kosonis]|uniref:ATP-dependent DNA helicase RecG n=1 Tax=Lentilactobacillus kosonis TaxID=2810561 RepID=A0A401FL56_9LACO|nr:ATP-dependent DNA helicase RecG [Lentilactobacillus kosonis]
MELNDPVGSLTGVGEKKSVALNKLGINTVNDLLTYYPRRYDDLSIKDPQTTDSGQKVTVRGTVVMEPTVSFFGRKKVDLSLR